MSAEFQMLWLARSEWASPFHFFEVLFPSRCHYLVNVTILRDATVNRVILYSIITQTELVGRRKRCILLSEKEKIFF